MPTITIEERFEAGGVLTDMTSVKLSNEDATAGLIRNDTSAVVIADDTAMTKTGTGVYKHTFTEPEDGLSYTYWVEWVYGGETYRDQKTITAEGTSSTTGGYIALVDIQNAFGEENVKKWSNLDNDADEVDTNRIAASIAYAEEQVDNQFRGGRYVLPFASNGGVVPTTVKDWCAKLAGIWLHDSRGALDEKEEKYKYGRMKKSVFVDMREYISGTKKLNAVTVTADQPSAPMVV